MTFSGGPYQERTGHLYHQSHDTGNEINSFSFLVLRDSLVPLTRKFCDVVSPATPEQFREAYSVARLLHIKGWADKFNGLFSWSDVNKILLHHQFDFPRMRLLREGKIVSSELYLKQYPSRRHKGSFRTKLNMDLFNEQVRTGATLAIDDVHEMFASVMALAAGIEAFVRESVRVNAYVSWESARALDLHWDDHDVLAIQLLGRKKWAIYGTTRRHPLSLETPEPPTSTPLWEEPLEAGDVLYVPRGWWHHVFPLGEPSIHLTFGIYRQTGIDFMAWLTEQLRSEEIFRQDLPRFATEEEETKHFEALRLNLLAHWDRTILQRFFQEKDGMVEPTLHAGFPWTLMSNAADLPDHLEVRLSNLRPLRPELNPEDNTIIFVANGKRWKFAAQTAPIFQELNHHSSRSIRELCEAVSESISAEVVREFLLELLRECLITPDNEG